MSADDIERALDSGPFATWAAPLAALAALVAEAKPARVVSPAEFLRRCVDGGARCVDVRSPGEFAKDAVPGAISVPLLDDAERAEVGKCYKKQGRAEAMRLGLAKLRKRGGLSSLATEAAGEAKVVGVYCWRGGLRSGSVAWLLARRGIDVFVLDGGYRAYKKHLRALFEQGPRVVIVGGRTGAGKTRVLRALVKQGAQVLDLEGLAAHRGSAFGALGGAAQPSNAAYETTCAMAWRALDPTRDVYVENEEGHVGRCLVPPPLYARMREAPRCVGVEASDAARVAHLLADYAEDVKAAPGGTRERLDAALARVAKRLGPQDTARARACLDAGDLAACARMLLARYYDKLYDRHLGKRGDAVLAVRAADPFDAAAVADAIVAAVARADAADLPLTPPVEAGHATRPPARDRGGDGAQWCAPS